MTDREAIKLTRMQTEALQAELAALETAGDIDAWKTAIEAKQLPDDIMMRRPQALKARKQAALI